MSAVLEAPLTELPDGWEWRALADLGDWCGGGTPSKQRSDFWEGGSIPWVSPKDMKSLRLEDTQDHITPAAVRASATKLFPAQSIALVVRSGILEHTLPVALIPFPATANQDMRVLTPKPEISSDWALWAILAAAEDIRRNCQKDGTTVASIDVGRMHAHQIPVPPRDEQAWIVRTVEELIAQIAEGERQLLSAIDAADKYRAAVLAAAFGDASHVLRDVADIQSGIAKGRPDDGATVEIPYIRTANVQAMRLELDEMKTLTVTKTQAGRYRLQVGDVLVLEGGDADKVGRGWIWSGEVEPCLHQNHVFAVRPHLGRLVPRYLAYYINAPAARAYFLSVSKQTTNLASINKTNLNALPVPVPSVEVQHEIIGVLDQQIAAADATHAQLRLQIGEVHRLRSAVIRAALTGKLTSEIHA